MITLADLRELARKLWPFLLVAILPGGLLLAPFILMLRRDSRWLP